MSLSEQEIQYYNRQLLLNNFGAEAQLQLKNSSIVIVGAGGLGCPAAMYLASAGVGRLALIDHDQVEISNLQRQVLYNMQDVGKSKAMLAKLKLEIRNTYIQVEAIEKKLTADNAFDMLMPYDIIMDCSDNFSTRYLINDICVKTDKTFISGSIFQYQGQLAVFNAPINEKERSGTYRCLFPLPPSSFDSPSCDQIGVLGAVAGFIGTLMALETIKIITGIGSALINQYAVYNLLNHQQQVFGYSRSEQDVTKLKNAPLEDDIYYENFCHVNSADAQSIREMSPAELKELTRSNEPFLLVDVREVFEHELLNIGGLSIPLNDLRARFFEIPRDKKVIVYCQVGQRSADALNYLQLHKGYTNVYQLKGGLRAYMNT